MRTANRYSKGTRTQSWNDNGTNANHRSWKTTTRPQNTRRRRRPEVTDDHVVTTWRQGVSNGSKSRVLEVTIHRARQSTTAHNRGQEQTDYKAPWNLLYSTGRNSKWNSVALRKKKSNSAVPKRFVKFARTRSVDVNKHFHKKKKNSRKSSYVGPG